MTCPGRGDPGVPADVSGVPVWAAVTPVTPCGDLRGGRGGVPGVVREARLFAYQAHALAAGGHPDQARDALADMRAHVVDLPRMPGAGLFGESDKLLWPAMTLVEIGDRREADTFAPEALAGAPPNLYEHRGLASLTIGQALAGRDLGAAADAGFQDPTVTDIRNYLYQFSADRDSRS